MSLSMIDFGQHFGVREWTISVTLMGHLFNNLHVQVWDRREYCLGRLRGWGGEFKNILRLGRFAVFFYDFRRAE